MTGTEARPIQTVGTRVLLAAIQDRARAAEPLPGVPPDLFAAAVRREIQAGNLTAGLTLTDQGRGTLARLEGRSHTGHLDVRRIHNCPADVDGRWRITCTTCNAPIAEHVADPAFKDAVFEASATHLCGSAAAGA